jgi:serine/threonine protein kinase
VQRDIGLVIRFPALVADFFPIPFGRYQLIERLAVGGMAEVFLATAPGEHGFAKKVVIKRLLPHLNADPTYNAMFVDEAKLTARLVHPKIAQTFELAREGDMLFIAMEYVDGIDVLALLRECAQQRRRIDPGLAAWICHEVLDALDYAHQLRDDHSGSLGIVHRDISPSNVLLSARGDVKLVDFGIARATDPQRAHKTKSGTLKGKYGYMSPEQVVEQPLDQRSDLFSVGVVLAELLTGRRLFAAANELDVLLMVRDARLHRLDKYGADLDPALSQIVRKALRKDPDQRFASAAIFRDEIAEWLFSTRQRITSRSVAEFVTEVTAAREELAARAAGTPTNTLASDGGAGDDGLAPALIIDLPPPRPGSARAASQGDGIPVSLDIGDSMPVVSVSYDESSRSHRAPSEPDFGVIELVPVAQATSRHRRPEPAEPRRATPPPPTSPPYVPPPTRNLHPAALSGVTGLANAGTPLVPLTPPGAPDPWAEPPAVSAHENTGAPVRPSAEHETAPAKRPSAPELSEGLAPRESRDARSARGTANLGPRPTRAALEVREISPAHSTTEARERRDTRGSEPLIAPGPAVARSATSSVPPSSALVSGASAQFAPAAPAAPAALTPGARTATAPPPLGGAPAYPSIAAAMGAVVPMEPDPSSRDFDGKTVVPGRRSAAPPMPSSVEEVASKRPAPPQLGDIVDNPDDAGDFAQISPLRVLFRLMLARSTGLLVVSVGGIKKEVYVRDGQPEYVSSNVASELFGSYLVSKGVLSDGELAMALAMMPHYGGRLGDTLVGLGLLKPLEVFRHLTRQVRTKLIDVCTWNKGSRDLGLGS